MASSWRSCGIRSWSRKLAQLVEGGAQRFRRQLVELVGDGAQRLHLRQQLGVLLAEALAEVAAAVGGRRPASPAAERPQRVEDDGDVDRLLQQGAGHRRQAPGGGEEHRRERQAHADDHALQGDGARAPRDLHRLGEPAEMVDGEHDVGGLRRRGGAAGPHGDADRSPRRAPGRRSGRRPPSPWCRGRIRRARRRPSPRASARPGRGRRRCRSRRSPPLPGDRR